MFEMIEYSDKMRARLFVKETSYIYKVKYYIKENSFIAKLAAKKLHAFSVAIVLGKTIHLHNSSKKQFINNSCWLNHELVHIKQFQQHGYLPFIIKYLWESIKKGYTNNKYEVEARAGENNTGICQDVTILI